MLGDLRSGKRRLRHLARHSEKPHLMLMLVDRKIAKPESVTTQMKALDGYNQMVLFVLILKRIHFLSNIWFNLNRRNTEVKG